MTTSTWGAPATRAVCSDPASHRCAEMRKRSGRRPPLALDAEQLGPGGRCGDVRNSERRRPTRARGSQGHRVSPRLGVRVLYAFSSVARCLSPQTRIGGHPTGAPDSALSGISADKSCTVTAPLAQLDMARGSRCAQAIFDVPPNSNHLSMVALRDYTGRASPPNSSRRARLPAYGSRTPSHWNRMSDTGL